jgi:uncharacterized protein (DUF302 family)
MGPEPSLPDPASGLVTLPSAHGADETLRRLEALLAQKGLHVFARIDHAAAARQAGLPLRPTHVILFGDPRVGTLLMQSNQTIGLDLPLKVLVWEDESGRAWLTYTDPEYLARRHRVRDRDETVKAMSAGLQALTGGAAAP